MKRQELTCLHTHPGGDVWGVSVQGVARPIKGFLPAIPLRAGAYRVIGMPENYRLITELYSALIGKETNATLLVGSPWICPQQRDTVEQVLSCVSVLDVHNSLCNTWHAMDSASYNNFLLLRTHQETGNSELLEHIYSYHLTRPLFQFLGLNQFELAVELLRLIGDPRWYLNPQRPYRMDRLESYFGLHVSQFVEWDADAPQVNPRTAVLLKILRALPPESFAHRECAKIGLLRFCRLYGCRRILSFVARNWLAVLAHPGYFDPDVFFRHRETRDHYLQQFRD